MLEVLGFRRQLKYFDLSVPRLKVKKGEVFVLLGPTGAGKSQFFQTLAGLFSPQEGRILVNGKDVSQMPPEQRGISILFQSPHLFPHLSVRENISFGRKDLAFRNKLVALLGLQQILDSELAELSGGQRQLVALTRALMVQPEVLLLDEPFSALDPTNRREVIAGFKRVQTALQTTCLMVTHSFEDSLRVGDRVGVLFQGKLVQTGKPETVFSSPTSPEIAHFLGHDNIFAGRVRQKEQQVRPAPRSFPALFKTGDIDIHVLARAEGKAYALIPPQEITLSTVVPTSTSALNALQGHIRKIRQNGPLCELAVEAGLPFKVVITPQSLTDLSLREGATVFLIFKASAVQLLQ